MLRTERQVALDNVINSGLKSIEYYRWVADASEDESLKTQLAEQGLQRERLVDQLVPQMYQLGDMPSSPDPEKLAIEEIAVQIKAAFSQDEKKVLLRSLDELDSELLRAINEALNLDFDENTTATLLELQDSVVDTREKRALTDED